MMFAALFGGIIIGYVLALLRHARTLILVPSIMSHYIRFLDNYNTQLELDKKLGSVDTIKRPQ